MKKSLLLFLLLALPALAAVQTGTVTRAAELRSTPFADGKVFKTLPAGTSVEVLKRNGGWYQVKSAGQDGWVRMWLLRFSGPAAGGTAVKDTVAVIQSGRSSATYTTATTGVRGLSEEDLAKAVPDPAAVQALEQLAVTQADAQGFARQASLKADPEALKQ